MHYRHTGRNRPVRVDSDIERVLSTRISSPSWRFSSANRAS